jgi:4Fe-4S ferredoxin
MKEIKTETENELTIGRLLHAKHYTLTLNKSLCTGCDICQIICPREAIQIKKQVKVQGERTRRPIFDISEQKCSYCGMCESICPFGALQVRVNTEHIVPVIEKEAFPNLIREIEVDASRCDLGCIECEKACPLNLIKVRILTRKGKEVPIKDIDSYTKKRNLQVNIDIKKEFCPCCRLCEVKCPKGAIHVRKIFHGLLNINFEKCPDGCQDCLDVCPIPGALYSEDDGKVHPNNTFCVFCGVCKLVCPVEDALKLERKSIHHTPISSGAWNKVLEKLTSTIEYSKEVKVKGWMKAQMVVKKRLAPMKEAMP